MICCSGCGGKFTPEDVLIAWLKGRIPNTQSCPDCGEIVPVALWRCPDRKITDDRSAKMERPGI